MNSRNVRCISQSPTAIAAAQQCPIALTTHTDASLLHALAPAPGMQPYTRRDTVAICLQQHPPRLKPSKSSGSVARLASGSSLASGNSEAAEGPANVAAAASGAAAAASVSVDAPQSWRESEGFGDAAGGSGGDRSNGAAAGGGRGEEKEEEGEEGGLAAALQHQHLAAAAAAPTAPAAPASAGGGSSCVAGPQSCSGEDRGGSSGGDVGQEGGSPSPEVVRGSFPFTLTVHNQYGPKWAVPLLERVEFSFEASLSQ
jgi:hypothetical protein